MVLSDSQIEEAQAEAAQFLETSIYTLSLTLGLDPAEVSSALTNPVGPDHHDYVFYELLKDQCSALEKIQT